MKNEDSLLNGFMMETKRRPSGERDTQELLSSLMANSIIVPDSETLGAAADALLLKGVAFANKVLNDDIPGKDGEPPTIDQKLNSLKLVQNIATYVLKKQTTKVDKDGITLDTSINGGSDDD